MLADIVTHTATSKLEDGGRKWRMAGGAHSLAGELTERAVNYGQSGGFGIHKLGCRGQQVNPDRATKKWGRSAHILHRRHDAHTRHIAHGTDCDNRPGSDRRRDG